MSSIGTKCVQAGYTPGNGEPRQIPIVQSTTFKYDTSEHMGQLFDLEASGYFYTRLQNPTNDAVAAKICALEGGSAAMLTSSGQAANFFAVFNIAECGDHVVASQSIYGGTFNLLAHTLHKMGIELTFVSPDCTPAELDAAFRPNTKCVFGETVANPALTVLDIEKFAAAAHAHGVPLIVDNTFPTPVMCRPIEWGADIVTHSTTKYMDGHGAGVGGAIVDSGNFDWMAHAEKFPGLCTPSSCATSAPSRARRTRICSTSASRASTSACRATAQTARPWPSSSRRTPRSRASTSPASRVTPTTSSPRSTCPTAAAASSPSRSPAVARRPSASWRPSGSAPSRPTWPTRAPAACIPPPPPTAR